MRAIAVIVAEDGWHGCRTLQKVPDFFAERPLLVCDDINTISTELSALNVLHIQESEASILEETSGKTRPKVL